MGSKKKLCLLVAAVACLRLGLWAYLSRDPRRLICPDSAGYQLPARNLARHGAFSASISPPLEPQTFRTPGYPAFLGVFELLGLGTARAPALVQALLDAGTAGLAALCAALMSPSPWAWTAAAFYGLDLMTIAHAPLILSETLFGFWLTLGLYCLLRAGPRGRAGPAAVAGTLLGIAALTRPVSLYLWIPLGAALAWRWRRWLPLAAFLVPVTLLPALWCARNARLFGHFAFSTVPGVNLLYYDAAATEAAATGEPVAEAAQRLDARLKAAPDHPSDPFEESAARSRLAREVFKRHPFLLARVHAVSGFKMLAGPGADLLVQELYGETSPTLEDRAHAVSGRGTLALLKRHPLLWLAVVWESLLLGTVYLLSLRGIWIARRREPFVDAAWLVPLAFLAAVSTGGWCYYRFRVPLWPLFCALAAAGL